ncbi:MAG: chemotaxis protein CheR, partial [Desulfobacterales bacterium]|nr:chemotaxis protein CheR [Desulfobacterales bacterium]
MTSLGIDDIAGYEEYLLRHEEERETLQSLCRVTISRFWRDRGVWLALEEQVLPDLAGHALSRGASALRAMSIGS